MLRWLLPVLVVLNLGFCTWSQGRLDGVLGVSAQGDREPERLGRQLRPESIRILTPESGGPTSAVTSADAAAASTAARALSAAASTTVAGAVRAGASAPGSANVPARTVGVPAGVSGAVGPGITGGAGLGSSSAASAANRPGPGPAGDPAASAVRAAAAVAVSGSAASAAVGATAQLACLEAGPFVQAEWTAALSSLAAGLPAGRWSDRRSETPGLWLIYMGRYADPEMLQKKKDEVAGIRVAFEEVRGFPALEPGLVLGRFDNRPAADAALARSVTQGIRTARVVLARPPVVSHYIRIPAADAALAARLSVRAPGPGGRRFQSC